MSKKTKAPAFQLYVIDFLMGTAQMSNSEVGAYIRLLCHQWDKKSLPNDKEILKKFCFGDTNGLDEALKKFIIKNGNLINKKLETVRKKSENYLKNSSENGKKGAKIRWGKRTTGKDLDKVAIIPPLAKNDSSASASASALSINNKLSSEQVFEFLRQAKLREHFPDTRILHETELFMQKYDGTEIKNLRSLCNTWASNMKPEPKKQMVE